MVALRIGLFAVVAAAGAAAAGFLVQFLMLRGSGADPLALAPRSLLVEVMQLHRHALLGALVGVVLAPFPPRIDQRMWAALRWVVAGVVVTLVWPLGGVFQAAGALPTVGELMAGYRFRPGMVPAGLGAGLTCALVELVLLWGRTRRQVAARRYHMGGENRVDETLREFWQERADTYLAGKSRDRGGDGVS